MLKRPGHRQRHGGDLDEPSHGAEGWGSSADSEFSLRWDHDLVTRDFPAWTRPISSKQSVGDVKPLLKPNTKAIYVEAMTNPLLQVADLEAVVQFADAWIGFTH
jgi:hypothetical protein